jgi:hypothetical protein
MKNSLSLGTRGKLSKNIKRSLVVASFGFIQISTFVGGGGSNNDWATNNAKIEDELKDRLLKIAQDDQEVVLIIKIFTQCQ